MTRNERRTKADSDGATCNEPTNNIHDSAPAKRVAMPMHAAATSAT